MCITNNHACNNYQEYISFDDATLNDVMQKKDSDVERGERRNEENKKKLRIASIYERCSIECKWGRESAIKNEFVKFIRLEQSNKFRYCIFFAEIYYAFLSVGKFLCIFVTLKIGEWLKNKKNFSHTLPKRWQKKFFS